MLIWEVDKNAADSHSYAPEKLIKVVDGDLKTFTLEGVGEIVVCRWGFKNFSHSRPKLFYPFSSSHFQSTPKGLRFWFFFSVLFHAYA